MANRKFMDTVMDENGNLHAIPFPEDGKEGMPYTEVYKDENGKFVDVKHEAGEKPVK
jgi:hypothetical protein